MRLTALLLTVCLLGNVPAHANDSIAEIGTGGLVLARTDAIAMDSEQLFISLDRIEVAYRFRNLTDKDVETIVAFPMPDVQFNRYGDTALPHLQSDNFLGFSATVEGQPVSVHLEQKAFAGGLDVTDRLRKAGVPLLPFKDAAFDALKALPPATLKDWIARGIVVIDRYDVGDGMKDHPTPQWTLRSSYWWRMTFPAHRSIMVEHRYAPSVGGTVGLTFFENGRFGGAAYDDYRRRYCLDQAFENGIRKVMKSRGSDYPPFTESRIAYVLRTGNNWAGPIGSFSVTVDKGSTGNLVSFCGTGVRKQTATVFEMKMKDFRPRRDFEVLFLKPAGF